MPETWSIHISSTTHSTAMESELVKLDAMALTTNEDEAINTIFMDINDVYTCSKRAIITGTNKVVDALNKILKLLHGDTITLHSVTRLVGRRSEVENLTPEYLISLTSQGVPAHELN